MPGTYEWLNAFWELGTDRPIGMSAGPIPSRSISEWTDRESMDVVEAQSFRSAIRAMDKVFLDWAAKPKAERENVESRPMTGALFDALFG
ncbi:phage tail assembly chaperone [Aurantimonas endophytica]